MELETCKNCLFYSAYYKKAACGFDRLNNGFCSKYNKAQIQTESCENYKCNEQKEKRREIILLNSLEFALISINDIAQILKEKNAP